MSDEATINASSLLSSLLGVTAANLLPTEPITEQISLLRENTSAFSQLLGSNIDAEGSFSDADAAFTQLASLHSPSANKDRLAVVPENFNRQLSDYPTHLLASDLKQSGTKVPASGSLLPPDSPAPSPLDSLQVSQSLGNAFLSTSTEQRETSSVDTNDLQLEQLTTSVDDLTAISESVEPPAALTPDSPSVIATTSAADLSGGRSRDPAAPTSNLSLVDSTQESNNSSDFSGDMTFDQQHREHSQDTPSDLRKPAGPTAEFALDTARKGDFQSNLTALSTLSTGELSNTSLPPLNQLSNTGPALANAPLTLVADRQLAGQQIAQHVASFVQQGNDSFEINLSPPHLGKISARIMLQNDQASVVLTAPSADIRELIEASLPKLSSLLEDAGLNLADANVSSQNQGDNPAEHADDAQLGEANVTTQETARAAPQQLVRGLLDAYA